MYTPDPPGSIPPLIDALRAGKALMPSFTFGYWPPPKTCVTVPSAADVSIVIPYLPLPMPSRLSNALGPLEGLVKASPDFTRVARSVKICRAVLVWTVTLVARPFLPLLLSTKVWLAVLNQVSRCHGSSFRPVPLPEALSALASATYWGSVVGGAFGFSPALVKASWL
jgi:hypothetical protein